MTAYRVYDVFTHEAFGGNQLAVIPDAKGLPESLLPQITREFNFSETVFVYPPEDPAHTAKVRIFTPTKEVDFAGHPTIGTTVALSDLGYASPMILELGVGPLQCEVVDKSASFTTRAALEIIATPEVELVAPAINLPVDAIKTDIHPPTQATLGLPFIYVELVDRDALRRCVPVTDAFKKGAAIYPAGLEFAIFAYCRTGDHLDARMFAPLDNIPEDPATGSACATVTALLAQIAGTSLRLDILQGEDMGRPSVIKTEALDGVPRPIRVSGEAVLTMEGKLVF